MDSIRQQKVSKLIQKEVSDIILKDVKHLCGRAMVTVTMVRISPDLSFARIYLSVFGGDPKHIVDDFNIQKTEIRYLLGKRIKNQVRQIPEVCFYLDDTLDFLERIDDALKK